MTLERVREKHMKIIILRKKQYDKQIKDKAKTLNKKTSKRYYKRTNKNKVYKGMIEKIRWNSTYSLCSTQLFPRRRIFRRRCPN